MQTLIDLDTSIFLYLNGLHSHFFDTFMMLFSGKLIWAPMYAAFLWMLWRCMNWKAALTLTLMAVVLIALADQTCASVIRPYIERVRPSRLENELSAMVHVVNEYRGGLYSFPSCHAANSFAFAVFASLIVKHRAWTWFILLWALVNSYSRIYLGVHFPGDLLVGAMIGSSVAFIIYKVSLVMARQLCHTRHPFSPGRNTDLCISSLCVRPVAVVMIVGFLTVAAMIAVSLCQ